MFYGGRVYGQASACGVCEGDYVYVGMRVVMNWCGTKQTARFTGVECVGRLVCAWCV